MLSPDRIVFTLNCTDALNLAIHGLVRPGDHVVTSSADHNSVLRPLRRLEKKAGIEITCVECDYHVQCRAGIHCAPRTHESLGTTQHGGTLRFSLGAFNTAEEIDWAVEAVGRVVA